MEAVEVCSPGASYNPTYEDHQVRNVACLCNSLPQDSHVEAPGLTLSSQIIVIRTKLMQTIVLHQILIGKWPLIGRSFDAVFELLMNYTYGNVSSL